MPTRTMRAVDVALGFETGADADALDAVGAVDFKADDNASPRVVVLERDAPTEWLRMAACRAWAGVATAAVVSLVVNFA
jgi:hypothetical protein